MGRVAFLLGVHVALVVVVFGPSPVGLAALAPAAIVAAAGSVLARRRESR